MVKIMSKTFSLLLDFISEFFGNPNTIPEIKLKKNIEIWKTAKIVRRIITEKRKPTINELFSIYPTIYTAVQWNDLKNNVKYIDFIAKCKKRIKNYNGTIFELDIISRAHLSGWEIGFIEDTTKPEPMIDFIFINKSAKKNAAVEVFSKKNSIDFLTIKKINNQIKKRSKKFKSKFFQDLKNQFQIDKKILIADITNKNFNRPDILNQQRDIKLSSQIDDIIFTWTNLSENDGNYRLVPKYFSFRNLDKVYFPLPYAVEILPGPTGPKIIFYKSPITEPTITIGTGKIMKDGSFKFVEIKKGNGG